MASPLQISLKVVGLDQAKSDLAQFAAGGKRSFQELADEAKRLADTSASTDTALRGVANRVRAMAADLDPAGAAAIRLRNNLQDVQRALAANIITSQQATTIAASLRASHEAMAASSATVVNSTKQMTEGFALNRNGLLQLQASGVNAFQALAAGMNPLRVAMTEGAQAMGAFVQGGSGFTALLRGLVSPTALVVAGVGALAAGFAILISRASDMASGIRQTDVLLRGMGAGALASATSLETAARRMREFGLSAADARTQINAVIQAGLNPALAPRIAAAGQNLIPVLGANAPEQLISALSGGVEAANKFGLAIHALSAEEAANFRDMARHGEGAQALTAAFAKIEAQVKGLNKDALSPSAQAFRDLRVAWNDMLDSLAQSGPVQVVVTAMTELSKTITAIASGMASIKAIGAGAAAGAATGAAIGSVIPGAGTGAGAVVGGVVGGLIGGNLGTSPQPVAAGDIPALTKGVNALTTDIDAALNLIEKFESGGRNIMQGIVPPGGGFNPSTGGITGPSTAQGFFQITNQSWRGIAPSAGIDLGQYPTAMSAPYGVQRSAAAALFSQQGFAPWAPFNPALAAAIRGGAGGTVGRPDENASADAVKQLTEARQRQLEVDKAVGLQADILRAKQEAEQQNLEKSITGLEAEKNISDAVANAKARFAAEIAKAAAETANEITGQRDIADAYLRGSKAGQVVEAAVKAATLAYQKFGEVSSAEAKQFAADRFTEISALETQAERRKNAQDLITQSNAQDVLRLELGLTGQTSEEIQRQVTLLQAKQQIEQQFPFLTAQEKADRLAMVQATADLNVKLAETQRAQQQMNSMFSEIGNTISSTIGSVISGIFDKNRITDWGQVLRSTLGSIVNSIAQALVVRPLTGELLGALGASPSVVSQFGTFGGSGSSTFSTGNVLQAGGLLKDVFGGTGSSSGTGLFGNFSNWLNNNVGVSLGFAPSGLAAGTGAGAGIFTDLGTGITSDIAGGGVASGLFGGTTLMGALGGVGLGAGAGGLLSSLLGGNSILGGLGGAVGGLAGTLLPSMLGFSLGPFGGLLGGALGGLLGLFGNNKPRNQSAGANFDLSSFALTAGFSGGNSQIDQATQQVVQGIQNFLAVLKTSGGALSGNVLLQNGVNTGFTVDSSLPGYAGRFNLGRDPTAVLNTVELALSRSLTGISDTMQTVINQVMDPAKIESAIAFATAYDNLKTAADDAFKEVEKDSQTLGPFAQAMQAINTTFGNLTTSAQQFGLSLEPINAGLAEATKRLQGDFGTALQTTLNEAQGKGFINQLNETFKAFQTNVAEASAIGLGTDTKTQDMIKEVFSSQVGTILGQLDPQQLQTVIDTFTGLNDAIVSLAISAENATTSASDAAAASDALAEAQKRQEASAQIQAYLNMLQATPSPAVSPEAALAASRNQFNAALISAQQGSIDAMTNLPGVADTLIKNIESFYASSQTTQEMVSTVEAQLQALIGPSGMTAASDPVVAAISTSNNVAVGALQAMQASNDNWLQSIFNVNAAFGDMTRAQLDKANDLLQQIVDSLRLTAAA